VSITVTDQFCGAGGSSLGADAVPGVDIVLAMNHWEKAIETHGTNFPGAHHACVDVACVDPHWFQATDILITSPECRAHSYARGRPKNDPALFDPKGDMAAERSRATMWDVPRFAEVHNYKIVIVENVVQAVEWGPPKNKGSQFKAWLYAMHGLGYEHQLVSFNSMFAFPTPQSRDRMYVVFWKAGNPKPDLNFDVTAWCPSCETIVSAKQTWKRHDRDFLVGRYGAQYTYVCPVCAARALPLTTPAAAAIDWELPAVRISDRTRPLAPATMARIRRGLERLQEQHMVVAVGGNTFERPGYSRTWPTNHPMPTVTTTLERALVLSNMAHAVPKQANGEPMGTGNKLYLVQPPDAVIIGKRSDAKPKSVAEPLPTVTSIPQMYLLVADAFVVPFRNGGDESIKTKPVNLPLPTQTGRAELGLAIVDLRGKNRPRGIEEPISTVCASGNHHGLIVSNYGPGGGNKDPEKIGGWARDANKEPIGTVTARDGHSLVTVPDAMVLPYRAGKGGQPVTDPLPTATTIDPYGLATDLDDAVENCGFRMLEPHEIAKAMVMDSRNDGTVYQVTGTKRDQVKQYGNAVTPPVMRMLVERCVASLQ
jgi:DNA (cytosine-5)-methyltransferase 1